MENTGVFEGRVGMSGKFPISRLLIRILEIAGAGLTSALVAYLLGRTDTPPPVSPPAVVHLAPADEDMIRTVRNDQAALLDQLRNDAQVRKTQAGPTQANAAAAEAGAAQPRPADVAPAAATSAQAAPAQTTPAQTTPAQATPAQAALAQGAQLAQIASAAPVMPQATVPQVMVPQFTTAPEVAVSATDLQNTNAPENTSTPQSTSAQPKAVKNSQQVRRDAKPEHLHLVEPKVRAEARVAARSVTRAEPHVEEMQMRPATGPVIMATAPAAAPVPVAPAQQSDDDLHNMGLVAALKGFTSRLLPSRDRVPSPDQGAARPPMPVGDFQQSAMSGGTRGGVSDF
jgi:hypothetical protein